MIKALEIKDISLHASDPHQNSMNIKRYYEQVYNSESCSFTFSESFDLSLLQYMFENSIFIYHSGFNMTVNAFKNKLNIENFFNYLDTKRKPNLYFKLDEYIIVLNMVDKNNRDDSEEISDDNSEYIVEKYKGHADFAVNTKKEKFNSICSKNTKFFVTIYYPNFKFLDKIEKKFSFLQKYKIDDTEKNYVSVLMKNEYGEYDFEPLDIKIPKIDIELNYGSKFPDVYDKIVKKITTYNKGLYMLHGDPGTGKSSFVKYLTKVVDKEFIFVPTSFIERFISDPDIFSILIKRKKSVLILEDAERILISREKQDNEYISTILNLSDGILSDMLEASIIITYNCDDTKIDKALKRKGRTMIDYRFEKLSKDDAKKLAESLNFKKEQIDSIDSSMSLSEIYNINDENKFYIEDEKSDRIVGFGKS
jgi:hypothetical protein